MSNVLVPIANGSEDIEAITIIDVLRRGGVNVTVASVHESKQVTTALEKVRSGCSANRRGGQKYDAIVLPGGMPGAEHLRDCALLIDMLEKHDIQDARFVLFVHRLRWCSARMVLWSTNKRLVTQGLKKI